MSAELNLRFPDPHHVIVRWGELETDSLKFEALLTAKERRDIGIQAICDEDASPGHS